ncbi:hypothetical protein ACH5RR_036348 [Cinchona calisaya]|uniref:Bet v I/Major latex protein domain-containing protein n=1 Tax=Cinchona calisaya TaxID=153742 RepID=A0ABD2Y2Y9_9GENT
MSLTGKLVSQIEIKSDGDLFYELFRQKPHHLSNVSPDTFQGVELHEGEWGVMGSVFFSNYTLDGKEEVAKTIIEAVDEEKRSVTYKVIEGHLLESYKTLSITIQADIHGESNLVTWTIDYEKLNETIPDPNKLIDSALKVTKEIETHYLK